MWKYIEYIHWENNAIELLKTGKTKSLILFIFSVLY